MDYYDILGLPKKSSIDDIKKQYKKLALIYHPDKCTGDRDKFEKIHKAYQILSDSEKKEFYDKIYDVPGDDASFNKFMSTLFDNLLASIHKIKKQKREQREGPLQKENSNEPKKIKPIINKINIPLDEVYRGDIKKLVIRVRRGDTWKKEIFFINLLEHNKTYIFEDQGDHIYGHKGDVEVHLNVLEHDRVKIDNILCEYDLYIEDKMSLLDYYNGINKDVIFLDGEIIHLDIKNINRTGKHTNYMHVVEGKGLPYIKDDAIHYGNLYIYFTLELPENINNVELLKLFDKSNGDSN